MQLSLRDQQIGHQQHVQAVQHPKDILCKFHRSGNCSEGMDQHTDPVAGITYTHHHSQRRKYAESGDGHVVKYGRCDSSYFGGCRQLISWDQDVYSSTYDATSFEEDADWALQCDFHRLNTHNTGSTLNAMQHLLCLI